MDVSGEFLRPEFAFDREFGQFRNWWARDKRIVGNAFSLLIYLVSHERAFRVTQKKAQSDLGLGRDAFLVARRKLENAGFLTVTEYRFPAGASDETGRPVGGHRRMLYTLQDPVQPEERPVRSTSGASADNPRRPVSPGSPPVDNSVKAVNEPAAHAESSSDPASVEKPAQASPSLKEDQPKENHSSSSKQSTLADAHEAGEIDSTDDDDFRMSFNEGTATLLRELHPRLDLRLLLDRLHTDPRLQTSKLDIEQAACDVIGAAARPVGDPIAYLATAINREPGRWVQAHFLESERPPTSSHQGLGRPPTTAECEASGHRWIGQWHEFCAACGSERPDWRAERDGAAQQTIGTGPVTEAVHVE